MRTDSLSRATWMERKRSIWRPISPCLPREEVLASVTEDIA